MSPRTTVLPALLLATSLIATATAQELFDAPVFVTAAEGGEFRATGDFDGDGHTDLLHMSDWLAWSDMSVFFNNGDGGLTRGPVQPFNVAHTTNVAQFDPALGDFDGNGTLDVAIGHDDFSGGISGLQVLFGDGAGGFTSHFLPYGRGPRALHAGQVDGDAAHELFVYESHADFTRSFVWLDWDGAAFQPSAALPIGGVGDPDGAFVLAFGDFDGDGDTDAAATSVDYQKLRLFPTVGGAPTFGDSWPVAAGMANVNHRIRGADFDGDGDDDLLHLKSLITVDPGPLTQVYENVGDGLVQHTGQVVPPLPAGPFGPHNLTLGDWDGDGWLDLFSNGSDLRILRSDGDWTWSDGGIVLHTGGQHPGAGVADLDGDGFADFAATGTLAFGDGSFNPAPGEPFGFALSSLVNPPHFVDYEGDGDLDMVGGGNIRRNDATGVFTSDPFAMLFDPLTPPLQYGRTLAFADFTGDGRRDYVVTIERPSGQFGTLFVEMRLAADDGFGHYPLTPGAITKPGVQIPGPLPGNTYWDTGDADGDGDGDLDLLVDGGWWKNAGTPFFRDFIPTWNGRGRGSFDLGGDGDIDFIVTRDLGITAEVALYVNNGGSYGEVLLATQPEDEVTPCLVDLDQDGDLDLWSGHPDLDGVLVWEHVGPALVPAPTLPIRGVQLRAPAFEDVDDDGVAELLLARVVTEGFPSAHWVVAAWEHVGPGLNFEPRVEHMLIHEVESFFDVDGDGDTDLFGHFRFENIRVPKPEGGLVRQFGTGFGGTGGLKPVVGVAGPIVSTGDAEFRLVWGQGGATAFILYGLGEAALAGVPFPGMTLYVDAPLVSPPVTLSGTLHVKGEGELTFALPTDPLFYGLTFVVQVFIQDGGSPTGYSATNGMEVTFGL